MSGFEFYTAPRIVFGRGTLERLPELLPDARKVLLVVDGSSSERGLRARIEGLVPVAAVTTCAREPRVEDVDRAVEAGRAQGCDAVVAAGGGAVLDCGKAASGMMTNPGSLVDYLEGVGKGLQVERAPLPMVAVPTTAGTGSEVTKNAVISGPGFKKSIRSPLLIPRVALVDPELTHSMPPEVTASCGMDALTQVLESYLSKNASPVTDGLALQGIAAAGRGLLRAYCDPDDAEAREEMALASLLGGVCLANAGLGAVHGFASPLGALHPIPHGVACAALLPQVVEANLAAAAGTPAERRLRRRLTRAAEALCGEPAPCSREGDVLWGETFATEQEAVERVLAATRELQRELKIPRLSELGITEDNMGEVVKGSRGSSMRYNPVELTDDQLADILRAAM
jgi:alcohol dehydrogenase class IV